MEAPKRKEVSKSFALREVGKSSIIKLDIDTKCGAKNDRLETVIKKLKEMGLRFSKGEYYFQKKSKKWHIYIWVESIAELWLPMIQLLLGSDWKRELLNFERVVNGEKDWNVLFQEQEVLSPYRTRELMRMLNHRG